MPLQQLIDVASAERPVRHSHRQAVNRDLGHEAVGYGFENHRGPGQPKFAGEIFETRQVAAPVGLHGSLPGAAPVAADCDSSVKKWRTAATTSLESLIEQRPPAEPLRPSSSNSRAVSLWVLRRPDVIST